MKNMKKVIATICASLALVGFALGDVYVSDSDDGILNKSTIRLAGESMTITYNGSGTNHTGGVKIYDFPEGRILVHGVVVDNFKFVGTSGIATNEGGDFAIGTVSATLGTIATTEEDLTPETSLDPFSDSADSELAAAAQFDGTATAVDAYVNVLVDSGDLSANGTGTVDCVVYILWSLIGDN